MRDKAFFPFFQVGFYTCCSLVAHPVTAQSISSDGTLSTPTEVNPTATGVEITGGTSSGGNLFHSFKDFSIPTGSEAFFNNASDVVNILNRVTGGNISNINGLLKANGSANLFLINPAGIVFGEGASLDIGGSFYGSTADSILFPDGVEFSATDTQTQPILTINAPIGLNFRDNPQPITNQSTANGVGLQVDTGKNITLVGGNLNFAGGKITAPGGRVELGGLSQAGEIGISNEGSLIFPDDVARADINLTNGSFVNVAGGGGGFININARNLTLSEKSQLLAGIAENSGSPTAQAGDITINATDAVKILGSNDDIGLDTEINNHVGLTPKKRDNEKNKSNAQGNAGAIFINTNFLEINNEGKITSANFSQGNSGEVFINANNILIERGAIFSAVIDGKGNVGNITINAKDSVVLDNGTDEANNVILSQVIGNGEGDAGDITINTGSFRLEDKSFILADNQGKGDAGNITINATDAVILDGSNQVSSDGKPFLALIISQVQNDVEGNGGDISISSPSISLANFSLISTNAKRGSTGQAGNITLNAETIKLDTGSVIDALTENDFDGGDININANFLELSNGGKIVTGNDKGGNAGNINLNIADNIVLNNGNPPNKSPFDEQILQELKLETGVFASNFASSTGNGGNIFISADSIKFEDQGSISAETVSGEGGNITLEVDNLLSLRNNSIISTEAGGSGNGGNIKIDAGFVVAFPNQNNDILADAQQGIGGNININTQGIFGLAERELNPITNDINASSQFSLDGNVSINTPDVEVFQETSEAPENVCS
ncbi:two-partner secretion domain-containing protein [Stanieria cyanosphaera]|uniref:two-partner secretion domain-containing protein n=1 Tax=Stanieria cyanosphaera TaxID=102116 RepID=UPI0002F0242B|nr:filamentous hemagglutinin N-terminal domain-containing protein [Stanieria cyanosphaera]